MAAEEKEWKLQMSWSDASSEPGSESVRDQIAGDGVAESDERTYKLNDTNDHDVDYDEEIKMESNLHDLTLANLTLFNSQDDQVDETAVYAQLQAWQANISACMVEEEAGPEVVEPEAVPNLTSSMGMASGNLNSSVSCTQTHDQLHTHSHGISIEREHAEHVPDVEGNPEGKQVTFDLNINMINLIK